MQFLKGQACTQSMQFLKEQRGSREFNSLVCVPTGTPIPYESLRTYFCSDPASRWGAYVAGCLLVLAHERGATFPDGISILVASDVPEGG